MYKKQKKILVVYLGLLSMISSPHLLSDMSESFIHHVTAL